MIIYEGPSNIDGKPIVVIATQGTRNRKTGDMLQTWVLRADIDPVTASRTGADVSICGSCVHRGTAHDGEKGQAKRRSCYVNLLFGPMSVYKAYRRGSYEFCTDLATLGAGKMIRIGSYGDGAAVPQNVWDELCSRAKGWTAYTHQDNRFPDRFMTSVESRADAIDAWDRGERTFRVIRNVNDVITGSEILCPASAEAGNRTTCENCKLCAGASIAARNIAIVVHGAGAGNWAH